MQRDAQLFLPANMDRQQYPRAEFDNLVLGSPDFRSDLVNWAAISSSKGTASLSPRDQALLWDLILFGDGGAFIDRIVTPVFRHVSSFPSRFLKLSQAEKFNYRCVQFKTQWGNILVQDICVRSVNWPICCEKKKPVMDHAGKLQISCSPRKSVFTAVILCI